MVVQQMLRLAEIRAQVFDLLVAASSRSAAEQRQNCVNTMDTDPPDRFCICTSIAAVRQRSQAADRPPRSLARTPTLILFCRCCCSCLWLWLAYTASGITQGALAEFGALTAQLPDVLSNLTQPLFAAQGAIDRNNNPRDPLLMRQLLLASNKTSLFSLHMLSGVNHLMVNVLRRPADSLSPELLLKLHSFLQSLHYSGGWGPM